MSSLKHVKSVADFLKDLIDATKDTPWPGAIAKALPWAGAVGEALGDSVAPIRFVLSLYGKLTKVNDPNELGTLACTVAFQRSVQQALSQMGSAFEPKKKEIAQQAKEQLKQLAPEKNYDFSQFTYRSARTHSFYTDARAALERFCELIDLDERQCRRVVVNAG